MTAAAAEKTWTFTIFIERQQGAFVAHALEAGLVATADDLNDVLSKIDKLLFRQIQFAEENDNPADIYHPCAKEVWDRYSAARHTRAASWVNESNRRVDGSRGLMLNQNTYAAVG